MSATWAGLGLIEFSIFAPKSMQSQYTDSQWTQWTHSEKKNGEYWISISQQFNSSFFFASDCETRNEWYRKPLFAAIRTVLTSFLCFSFFACVPQFLMFN